MGIALTHQQIPPQGIELPALIPGHHPCRQSGGTHQQGERPGVVLAKAASTVE